MNEIQKKLKLIDQQINRPNLHKKIINTCPLFFAAAGLIAGILTQNTAPLTIKTWLTLLSLAAITAIFILNQKKTPALKIAYTAAFCFLCLGAIRMIHYKQLPANNIKYLVTDQSVLAQLRGSIISRPFTNRNERWKFAKLRHTDPTSSFYLKINQVETTKGWTQATGTIRVQIDEPVLDLKTDDYIELYCSLTKFKSPASPGQFNIAECLARKNIFIAASVKSRDAIKLLKRNATGFFGVIKRNLRQAATNALITQPSLESQTDGLLEALLLGYRGHIDAKTYTAFNNTGLLHFISLSGMHLGILIGCLWWLCKTAGLMKRSRSLVCIIALTTFLLIVPPRPPTIRAAVICYVFCASFLFRRKPNSFNSLSLAALILLLIQPTTIFQAGFQLSFASVLGILLFTEPINIFLQEKIIRRFETKNKNLIAGTASKIGKYSLTLFSVGLAAWLGGAGILLYHFNTITPLTSLWTVLVFPFVAAILTLGYLKIILSFILPTLAFALGTLTTILAQCLIAIVTFIANLNISQILIGNVPAFIIISYYASLIFTSFANFRPPLTKKAICTAATITIIAFLGITKLQRTYRTSLILTCLDVGHGQAILAQMPGKANIIFDTGSLNRCDIANKTVIPFLNYKGTNKIDSLIISHNDTDHINAIPEIAENCSLREVYANNAFFDKNDRWGTAEFLTDCLKNQGLEIKPLDDTLKINSPAEIKILWPTPNTDYSDLSDNNKSAVCLIEYAGRKILLCSDIEKFAQTRILRLYPNLKPDVLILPHHGSTKTLNPDFLESLTPNIMIASCSRHQYQQQLKNKSRLFTPKNQKQKSTPKIFYTAKHGSVTVKINKNGRIKTKTHLKN